MPTTRVRKEAVWQGFSSHFDELRALQAQLQEIDAKREDIQQQLDAKKRVIERATGLDWQSLITKGLVSDHSTYATNAAQRRHNDGTLRADHLRQVVQSTCEKFDNERKFTLKDVCACIETEFGCNLTAAERKRISSVLQWDGLYGRIERHQKGGSREPISYRKVQSKKRTKKPRSTQTEHIHTNVCPETVRHWVLRAIAHYEDSNSQSRIDEGSIRIYINAVEPAFLSRHSANCVGATLKFLQDDGCVTRHRISNQGRFRYHLTAQGRAALK